MRPFRQVAIFGTGLLGGSIGLALRRRKIARVGFDRPEVLRKALKLGAIDRKTKRLKEAIVGSDLVILAVPVGEILEFLPKIARLAAPATLITDVGSTKKEICRLAKEGHIRNFVGGHPLAGKERAGIENADGGLFFGKSWFLCANGNLQALGWMKSFVRLLGARPVLVEPEEHDRILAATSHLPQLVSSLLAATIGELLKENTPGLKSYAGTGLQDAVRLAASPFSVWKGIFATNHSEVKGALGQFSIKVNRVALVEQGLEFLGQEFEKANSFVKRLK